ncbi:MAG: def1 [Firmicutes bacterium]|nr:def1 [Bacillota bacterium]
MAVLEIRKAGDKILKEIAAPVAKIDKRIRRLLDDMAQTMYAADGVGLAAPQVGLSLRIVVIDVGDGLVELINPVITETKGCVKAQEGCLSIPGVMGEVERYAEVTVEALDRNGKKIQLLGTDLLARAFQHEIDHLEGVLFIDRATTISTQGQP